MPSSAHRSRDATTSPAARQPGWCLGATGFTGFKTAAAEELPDAVAVMDPFHVVRLVGDALDQCRQHALARFDTHRISKGGIGALNLIIEETRRLAHGFRTFEHYRLRILLAVSGTRFY